MARIMIINWKFKFPNEASSKCKEYSIVNSNDDKLICCNYDNVKNFTTIINKYDQRNYKLLIMLHTNSPNSNISRDSGISCENAAFKIFEFSGGADIIYYSQDLFPKGLLASNDIVDSAIKNNEIIKEHFDFVWDYYWNLCKRKLFELKEELLFCLYPLSFQDKKTFKECLGNDSLIEIRIKDLLGEEDLNDEEKNKIEELEKKQNNHYSFSDCRIYYQKKSNELFENLKDALKLILKNNHDELLKLIENKFNHIFPNPGIKTIPEFIRYQFDELLNTMDEPIY